MSSNSSFNCDVNGYSPKPTKKTKAHEEEIASIRTTSSMSTNAGRLTDASKVVSDIDKKNKAAVDQANKMNAALAAENAALKRKMEKIREKEQAQVVENLHRQQEEIEQQRKQLEKEKEEIAKRETKTKTFCCC